MSTAVEQSLQVIMQEPAAAIAVAVLLGGGLVGMSIRTIVESVVDDGDAQSKAGAASPSSQTESRGDPPAGTTRTSAAKQSDETADPEELEHRLDELETEVGSLSSTVDTVRAENKQISNSVAEIERSTSRLVRLFKKAIGGNPKAPEVGTEPSQSENSGETGDETEIEKTEISEPGSTGAESNDKANASSGMDNTMGVREKHCVDSDEEVIDAPGREPFQANGENESTDEGSTTDKIEEVEEIGAGTFEGTRFRSPNATSETFGVEETIDTPAVASDGGTAVASESDPTGGDLESETGTVEPEKPSMPGSEPESTAEREQEPASESDPDAESDTDQPDVEQAESESDVEAEAARLVAEADPAKTDTGQSTAEVQPETGSTPEQVSEPEPSASTERESSTAPEIEPETTQSESAAAAEPGPQPQVATLDELTSSDTSKRSGKPYLETLPEGFGAELLTVEWLEYLVTEVGIRETSRALGYYKTIGWLTEEAAAELDSYLDGLAAGDRGKLSVEHHLRTLEYVDELTIVSTEDAE